MAGQFEQHSILLFDLFEHLIRRMHDLHGGVEVRIPNVLRLETSPIERHPLLGIEMDIPETLLRRSHRRCSRAIAIRDRATAVHRAGRNCSWEVWRESKWIADANECEVESEGRGLWGQALAEDDD